jgi:hypothetical protein
MRCETEPDLVAAPNNLIKRVVGGAMPSCFGVQGAVRVKRGVPKNDAEDPILALLKQEAEENQNSTGP